MEAEPLTIEGTEIIPAVNFNAETGKLEIKGRCIPEDSRGFYQPLIDWVKSYADNPQPQTEVSIFMEYFNTSSSKYMLDVLTKLAAIHSEGKSQVTVKWHYEEGDENIQEAGEDLDTIIDIPFELIEVPEEE